MDSKITQPKWQRPADAAQRPPLKLYNSLTRTKTEFVPLEQGKVSWYSCGPTVYDQSHMGHARNYVSIDINRRLLEDYFGYNVAFVQNVTDIDDKIIVRARQRYLFDEYAASVRKGGLTAAVKDHASAALKSYTLRAFENLGITPPLESAQEFRDWREKQDASVFAAKDPKYSMHCSTVQSGLDALDSTSPDNFLSGIEGSMVQDLDRSKGHTVVDPRIFRQLSSFYENDFNEDMARLNVRAPLVTTRVSEYIPEIIDFTEKIVRRGYAYATDDGSVYFDVAKFDASPDHDYAKLQPWNKGVQELIDEGEGSLSTKGSGKKSKSDFALWKASKPGEPAWESPWGKGRPGWHIECSVMACHVLGPKIDIHTGGIDLAFPHHDNELAQSEACFDSSQWINYFLHTGHLHIEGQKMSKSLKNFITIKEALAKFSSRQLRLTFAMQQWNTPLDFKLSLSNVKAYESTLSNFFNTIKALGRETTIDTSKKVGKPELALLDELYKTQAAVDESFADNLSTPLALQHLNALIVRANSYIVDKNSANAEPKFEVLRGVAVWITDILRILGFEMDAEIGWASESTGSGGAAETVALPYVQVLAKFRQEVRKFAMSDPASNKALLEFCDNVRDVDLFDAGVALDDRRLDQAPLIKFLSPSERAQILTERETAQNEAEEKAKRKAQAQKEREEQDAKKREQAKIKPQDMFKGDKNFSKFDENGVPTHDSKNGPLTKSAIKKLQKQWQLQDKLHKQYISPN